MHSQFGATSKVIGVYYRITSKFIITSGFLSMEVSLAFIFNCNWPYCFQCLINMVEFLSSLLHLFCLELVTNADGYKNISFIADKAGLKNKLSTFSSKN